MSAISTTPELFYVIRTERLALRRFVLADAPFILELLNEPGWLRFIGDKGVRSLIDAQRYLEQGPLDMYARLGFGMYLVELPNDAIPVGMCGLIKRDALEDVDIGFAFLERHTRCGYALEAATAVIEHARELGLKRLLAITTQDNHASQRLLAKVRLQFNREITMPNDTEVLRLFSMNLGKD